MIGTPLRGRQLPPSGPLTVIGELSLILSVDERAADVLAGGAQGGVEVVEVVERRAREVARLE